jgi:DNA-3-methyladenine glycosylase I
MSKTTKAASQTSRRTTGSRGASKRPASPRAPARASAATPRAKAAKPAPPPSFAPDERPRCGWSYSGMSAEYVAYHDREWGVPVHDDTKLFEFLVLEGAQAGLSWSTILRKRAGYREAFADFDVQRVARFDKRKVERLMVFPAIVRNRLKIEAAIVNARCFLAVQEEFGSFDSYSWSFVGNAPIVNRWGDMKQVPATTKESDAFSKDLRRRGFKFVGSTIIYAHMQATGMVNDHVVSCYRHGEVSGR